MNNTPPHSDDKITKKKPISIWKSLIYIKIERKRWRGGDYLSKIDPKSLHNEETEKENLERKN